MSTANRWVPLALALAWASPAKADAPVRYVVRSDADLAHLDVEVCFEDAPSPALIPGIAGAAPALIDARDAAGRSLPTARGRIDLSGVPAGGCVRYRVDLARALSASRFAGRFGSDVVTSAGAWLWRPPRLPHHASVRFDLPSGITAATPWPRERGVHRLDASAFQRPCFMAFGRFTPVTFARGGAQIEAVRLGDGWQLDHGGVQRWLTRVVDGVSTVQGRFPVDRLLVVMVPSGGAGIGFGMVRRGGGHSVGFVVGPESSENDLEQSWVAWHELSHLLLPPLPQRDAWLYEGLATYYQEILPARAGVHTASRAWSSLLAGFDRGARATTGNALHEDASAMHRTGAFSRVYWAGTAFVLEADVALRARGSSLDEALARGASAWRSTRDVWSSERVCALWDREVLGPMRARYADAVAFPSVDELLARLGVHREARAVELGDGPLRAVRDAITSP